MTITELQKVMENGITITKHAKDRLIQRDIKISDIKNSITTGKIIEDYPNRNPYPAVLILGSDSKGNSLHIIVANDGEHLKLVTAYYPDSEHFKNDNITRI